MKDFDQENNMDKILKSTYQPVVPQHEFKERLLGLLQSEGSTSVIWRRPRFWIPVAAAIISAFIGYGIWLSLNIIPRMIQ